MIDVMPTLRVEYVPTVFGFPLPPGTELAAAIFVIVASWGLAIYYGLKFLEKWREYQDMKNEEDSDVPLGE